MAISKRGAKDLRRQKVYKSFGVTIKNDPAVADRIVCRIVWTMSNYLAGFCAGAAGFCAGAV